MLNLSVRTTVVVGLIGLGCGLAFDVRAQESGAVDWMRVDVVNVVPQRLDDYIELQLEEVNPALQRAGVPWRAVWRTGEFGPTYELRTVTPITNLTDYDTGGPVARVMRPDRFSNLLDRVRSYTASRDSFVIRYRPELSAEVDDGRETSGEIEALLATAGEADAAEDARLGAEVSVAESVPGNRARSRSGMGGIPPAERPPVQERQRGGRGLPAVVRARASPMACRPTSHQFCGASPAKPS